MKKVIWIDRTNWKEQIRVVVMMNAAVGGGQLQGGGAVALPEAARGVSGHVAGCHQMRNIEVEVSQRIIGSVIGMLK